MKHLRNSVTARMFILGFMLGVSIFIMIGCGHSMTHTDRGLGLKFRIPTPDGGSLIDLALGNIDSTTTVLRGNTTYNGVTTGSGSILGSGGITQTIQVSAGPQVNEGNVRKILADPNCPAEAKIELVKMLAAQQAPKPSPTSATTANAAANSGTEQQAQLPKSELGAVIDKAPEILDAAAKPISATAAPVKAISEPTMSAVEKAVKDAMVTIKSIVRSASWVLVVLGVTILLLSAYGIFRYIKYRVGQNSSKTDGAVPTVEVKEETSTAGQASGSSDAPTQETTPQSTEGQQPSEESKGDTVPPKQE